MSNREQHLQDILLREIPLTVPIGVIVKEINENSVTLVAPLVNNVNHKSTAFGGSLYCLSVLAGWGVVYTQLEALNIKAHIVIQEGNIKHVQPVSQDIEVTCRIKSRDQIKNLIRTFKKRRIARLTLNAEIKEGAENAVIFQGKYVIYA